MSDVASCAPLSIRVNRSSEELEMRKLCASELRKLWPDARIIHELPTRYSTNRIDLAAVTETEIVALEIKSSRDVADRLEAQLRAFEPIAHRLIVALAPKWAELLPPREETRKMPRGSTYTAFVPQYNEAQAAIHRVGSWKICVWTVNAEAGTVQRTPLSYRIEQSWARRMLDILHVQELVVIAGRHRVSSHLKSTHFDLATRCAELMTGREVERAVCAALRRRDAFDQASDAPIFDGDAA